MGSKLKEESNLADSKMSEKEFKNKLNSLIKEYKKAGKVQYDELNKKFAEPMNLNADQMDKIIEHVEDAGISVVDENGEPSKASLKAADHTAEEAKKETSSSLSSGFKVNDLVRMYLKEIGDRKSTRLNSSHFSI